MSKRARSPKSQTHSDKRMRREAEDMAEAARRIDEHTLEIEGFEAGNTVTEAATDAEADYMLGPEPAALWLAGCEHFDWFTPPGTEYVDVKKRHPEKNRWSPPSQAVLGALLPLYKRVYDGLPWAYGWRQEFKTNDHRWFPPQSIVDAFSLDTAPTVSLPGLAKLTRKGLTSPQVQALLHEL